MKSWDPSRQDAPKRDNNDKLFYLNVGTGKDIQIKDLANLIASIIGFKGEIRWDQSKPDGTLRKKLDTKHASSLGWESKISLDEGLKITFQDFLKKYSTQKLKK